MGKFTENDVLYSDVSKFTDKQRLLWDRLITGDLSEHLNWYLDNGYSLLGLGRQYDRFCVVLQHLCGTKQKYLTEQIIAHTQCNNKECRLKRTQETNKSRYGDVNFFNTSEFKNKTKDTNMTKYGVPYYSQTNEFKQRASESYKETMQTKYGVDNYFQTNEFQIKRKSKIPKDFSPLKVQGAMDKYRETSLHKYGTTHPSKSKEVKDKIYKTTLSKYGVPSSLMLTSDTTLFTSDTQEEIIEILSSWGVSNIHQNVYLTSDWTSNVDIYLPDHSIAIEYNGTHWHANKNPFDQRRLLATDYHLNKSLLAESRGIFLYHLFEYDFVENREKILNQLYQLLFPNKLIKLHANSCYISDVPYDDASMFLDLNHIQGRYPSGIRLGLYLSHNKKGLSKDTLVALMTFNKPITENAKRLADYELTRFCTLNGYKVYEAASTLFNYFVSKYNPTGIISYSDIGKTRGTLYNKLGFTTIGMNYPRYVWTNKQVTYKRRSCQKQFLPKLLNDPNIDLSKTEDQLMLEHGFYKVYDAGTRIHLWTNKTG